MASPSAVEEQRPAFLFITCQVGAERALKAEMARQWPAIAFAYSRPGFLTFKLPPESGVPWEFDPQLVFGRAWGFSLGKVSAATLEDRAKKVGELAKSNEYQALHVWQRDMAPAGFHGYDPHITSDAHKAEAALRQISDGALGSLSRIANSGQMVLDCILVEPEEWWVGCHRAGSGSSCLPGGLGEITLPAEAVSRAYLKIQEGLDWSGLPARTGQRFVEIGCSPGGASQALLERGFFVIGIDPAAVDPRVIAHPNFTHVQKRGADVRRREYRGVDWLAADMNVAPQYTLDTVEAIVTHPAVKIRGLLLTLKILDWDLAEQIPAYLARMRSWGFDEVRAKQLAHNRQEICAMALRKSDRTARKPTRIRRSS